MTGLVGITNRYRELGRIRLGERGVTDKGKTFPKKLAGFRLTSQSKELLCVAADLYGGDVRRWDTAPGEGVQWELYLGDRIDVLIPPGETLTQSFELWSGGGCQRRCNGLEMADGGPCQCPADMDARIELAATGQACKPTTRLSVILPRIPDIGVWRMESHGYNAAVEMPGTVALLRQLAGPQTLIPAFLRLEPRTQVKAGQTRRFAVPVLELPQVTIAELTANTGTPQGLHSVQPAAIAARSEPAATEPPPPQAEPSDPVDFAVLRAEIIDLFNKLPTPAQRRWIGQYGSIDRLYDDQMEGCATWTRQLAAETTNPPPAPVVVPATGPTPKPEPTNATRKKWATQIHIRATRVGLSDADLDAVILNATKMRTCHANQLDGGEVTGVNNTIDALANDDTLLARIRTAVTGAQPTLLEEATN